MNNGALRAEFERDGFLVVRQFLPPEDLQQLRSELARYIREIVPGLPDSEAFYQDRTRGETLKQMQRMGRDSFFDAYRRHPHWTGLAGGLLGEAATADEPEWFNKPPGVEHVTPPHQDNFYFCLEPAQVLTMWLALDPVDEENGCLRYLPGSHLRGIRPHGRTQTLGFSQGITDYTQADREAETAVILAPGDVAIHHGNTIHRADANKSHERQRRSFALVFRGASCRRDEAAYARYALAARQQHQELGLGVGATAAGDP